MECAKCGEYFTGTCVSLKCYDILYNEKKDLEQENAKLKAKLNSIEEGLKRLGKYTEKSDVWWDGKFNVYDGDKDITAPTLADLIDKIITGG